MVKTSDSTQIAIMRNSPTWRTARVSIFTALAVVGSFIKPGGPVASLAFDSFAGFFVALRFGAVEGTLVCGLGHLATAAISGFALGWIHIPIALGMALAGLSIGLVNKVNKTWGFILALAIGVAINTVIVIPLAPWLGGLENALIIVAPPLLVVAALNAILAGIVYVALRGRLKA